jgi:hypothetical protein
MSRPLYEITQEFLYLFESITEALEDVDIADKDDIISNTLANVSHEFDNKALNVARYIANLEHELLGVKEATKRLQVRAKATENKIDKLREYLLNEMRKLDKKSIKSDEIMLTLRNNPAKVVITDEESLPADVKYKVTEIKVDKKLIADKIKSGEDVRGAVLTSSQRLEIK